MSLVALVSGGLDSTLMSCLAHEQGTELFPLFVNYGQMCSDTELDACRRVYATLGLPQPTVMNLRGFGQTIPSGLTDPSMSLNADAFLPGRNLLLVVAGAAYAYSMHARAVAIGLLSEQGALFPDQLGSFLAVAQEAVSAAVGSPIAVVAPLMGFTKRDIIALARAKGIEGTYSCHSGSAVPCGVCVSCVERLEAEKGGL